MFHKSKLSKTFESLKIAELSDIHLGHANTPTAHVIACLHDIFPDNLLTQELDIIILAGDVFDRQLQLAEDVVFEIHQWMCSFLGMCKKYDITLIVLEGTPSHDWKQSEWFNQINLEYNIGADVYYAKTLDVVYFEKFGIDILFIPDEWSGSCDDTKQQAIKLLKQKNLSQVDFTVMHGVFPHQMPKHIHNRIDMHDPDYYSKITKRLVFVGHVHLTSQWQNILSAGSTTRLVHGEEGPKGHFRITSNEDSNQIDFIVNKRAMKYLTVDATDKSAQDVKDLLKATIALLKNQVGAIRVLCRSNDPAIEIVAAIKENTPLISWTVTKPKKETKLTLLSSGGVKEVQKLVLNKNTLNDMLLARIASKHPEWLDRCRRLLEVEISES